MNYQHHDPSARHVAAMRALLIASQNYQPGTGLVDALQIHTADLSRHEVLAVLALLLGVMSTVNLSEQVITSQQFGNPPIEP
ncbi:hypothetical protein [Nocardia sp. CA-120079]|uniref:hypothetical protein n=1 Tax=Nocardia sp. CA-120079 TaxID=3239974 RepID=UPI003D98F446